MYKKYQPNTTKPNKSKKFTEPTDPVNFIIGKCLKIIKNGTKLDEKHRNAFNSIKHGNYLEFFDLYHGKVQPSVFGDLNTLEMKIMDENTIRDQGVPPFVKLLSVSKSLQNFWNEISPIYPMNEKDRDVDDSIYFKSAAFETDIRMYSYNYDISFDTEEELNVVIKKFGKHFDISNDSLEKLHNGRKFLNNIKHRYKRDKVKDWNNECIKMKRAYEELNNIINNEIQKEIDKINKGHKT